MVDFASWGGERRSWLSRARRLVLAPNESGPNRAEPCAHAAQYSDGIHSMRHWFSVLVRSPIGIDVRPALRVDGCMFRAAYSVGIRIFHQSAY